MGAKSCSQTKSKLLNLKDQNEIEEVIKKEKKKYYVKCDELSLKFFTDVIKVTSVERSGTNAIKYVNEQKLNPFKILQTFIDGLNLIEKELKKKKFSEIEDIALLIEKYLEHGNDQDEFMILSIKDSIKEWFLKNS